MKWLCSMLFLISFAATECLVRVHSETGNANFPLKAMVPQHKSNWINLLSCTGKTSSTKSPTTTTPAVSSAIFPSFLNHQWVHSALSIPTYAKSERSIKQQQSGKTWIFKAHRACLKIQRYSACWWEKPSASQLKHPHGHCMLSSDMAVEGTKSENQ